MPRGRPGGPWRPAARRRRPRARRAGRARAGRGRRRPGRAPARRSRAARACARARRTGAGPRSRGSGTTSRCDAGRPPRRSAAARSPAAVSSASNRATAWPASASEPIAHVRLPSCSTRAGASLVASASSSKRPAPSRQTVCAEAACMRRCGLRSRAYAAASRPAAKASSKRPPRAQADRRDDQRLGRLDAVGHPPHHLEHPVGGLARLAEAVVGVAPAERLEPVREQLRGADPLGDLDRPLGGAARLRELLALEDEPADHRRAADQQRPDLERVALLRRRPPGPASIWATAHSRHSGRVNAPG